MIGKELAVVANLGRRAMIRRSVSLMVRSELDRRQPSQSTTAGAMRSLSSTQRVADFAQDAKDRAAKEARDQNDMAEKAKTRPSAHVKEQLEKTNNQPYANGGSNRAPNNNPSEKSTFEKGKEKLSQGAEAVKEKAGEVKQQIKETMGSGSTNAEKYKATAGTQRGYAQTNAEKYGDARSAEQRAAAPSNANRDAGRFFIY